MKTILVLHILIPITISFSPLTTKLNSFCSINRKAETRLGSSQKENENNSNEEIDSMREKLESLLHNQEKEYNDDDSQLTSKAPKSRNLNDSSRKRLIAEMKLLQSLKESDSAVSVLWSFWFSECGMEDGKELVEAERQASLENFDIAEEMFQKLIQKHGENFVEPMNRYATMLYMQGRLEESKEMCENVLSVKPWHFGALSGIVLVCAGLNDMVNAQIWSSRKLPPLNAPEERKEWVDRAVQEINSMLSEKQSETIAGLNPDSFDDAWL